MLEREMRAIKSLQNVTALYSVVRCGQDCRLQVECSGVCSKHVPRRQNIVTLQVTEKRVLGYTECCVPVLSDVYGAFERSVLLPLVLGCASQ